jgi:glycopeptide antibiotics resistance protein
MDKRSVNLAPFAGPSFISAENILNVLIFVPLGLYTGVLFEKWSFGIKFLFVFLFSFLVEGLQYMLRIGAFDLTDIITNTSGGIIGLMIAKGFEKAMNNRVKAQKFINIVAAMGTVTIIVLLVLLKMKMLPIRYQ